MTELDRLIDLAVNLDDESLLSLSQEGEDHIFSDTYNTRMQLLFRQPKPKARKRTTPWRYAVASVLIVFTLAGAATAGAFWAEITAFFQTFYSQYTNLGLTPEPKPSPLIMDDTLNSWPEYWYPDYMEAAYSFASANEWGDIKLMVFSSDDGNSIQFEQMPASFTLANDIEGLQIPNVTVGNFEAFALEKEIDGFTFNTLVWSDSSTTFRLVGQASLKELVKIAEHIVFVENVAEK